MKKNDMTVVVRYTGIDPDRMRRQVEVRPFYDGLEYLQKLVDGHIEHFVVDDKLDDLYIDMWINEEGKFREDFRPSFALVHDGKLYDVIVGPCLFTKYDDQGETHGLSLDEMNHVIEYLNDLEMVALVDKDGKQVPVLKVEK